MEEVWCHGVVGKSNGPVACQQQKQRECVVVPDVEVPVASLVELVGDAHGHGARHRRRLHLGAQRLVAPRPGSIGGEAESVRWRGRACCIDQLAGQEGGEKSSSGE